MNETIRNKVSSLNQPQTMCLRDGPLLPHNILGSHRIRQIHTFKLPPNHLHEMITVGQLSLRHRQQ